MRKQVTHWIFLLMLILFGCEEAFDQNIEDEDEIKLVVEARFTNERIRHEVRLSTTFLDLNDTPPPVTNALVAINDGDSTFFLNQDPSRPGIYLTDSIQALFGRVYTLYIAHEGVEYLAFATSDVGTSLPPLALEEIDTGVFEYVYSESIPSMTEVKVVWDELDSLGQLVTKNLEAFFYTLNVIDVNKTFAPGKDPIVFPSGATVHRKKYSLTQGHQDFLRSFLSEVDWRGGGFDVEVGNVLTNISGGAVGYFSVSMVDIDSTLVE